MRKKDIEKMFGKYGEIEKIVIPPYGLTALVKFLQPISCRNAFRAVAYKKVKDSPIYLERAPIGVFNDDIEAEAVIKQLADENKARKKKRKADETKEAEKEDKIRDHSESALNVCENKEDTVLEEESEFIKEKE